jgi:hypothetical protein
VLKSKRHRNGARFSPKAAAEVVPETYAPPASQHFYFCAAVHRQPYFACSHIPLYHTQIKQRQGAGCLPYTTAAYMAKSAAHSRIWLTPKHRPQRTSAAPHFARATHAGDWPCGSIGWKTVRSTHHYPHCFRLGYHCDPSLQASLRTDTFLGRQAVVMLACNAEGIHHRDE